MSTQEIAKLIGDLYENLIEMINHDQPSYESINPMVQEAKLQSDQFNHLVDLAIKNRSDGAIASLMEQNMTSVISKIPNNNDGEDLLEMALGAGLGENLLHQWFLNADQLPPRMRKIIKNSAKQIMIDLAKKKANALIGSSEAGSLPEGSIRPYFSGDDPDLIDLEETLDNILYLGKHNQLHF